jgi:hypothetical protein
MGELDMVRFEVEPAELEQPRREATAEVNRIVGQITRCSHPARAVRVDAFEELTIGIEDDGKPCRKATETRRLGTAFTGSDGSYSISYPPPPPPDGFCAYSARVWVELSGDTTTWRSAKLIEQTTVRIDHELFPDCTAGETVVFVGDESGRRMGGAEVFVNGRLAGTTNDEGLLVVSSLAAGDRLVARLVVDEHPRGRGPVVVGTGDVWNYRTSLTTLRLRHDGNGDNVELLQRVVTDPTVVQGLLLSTWNTLIGLSLVISIEWDATANDVRRFTDRLTEMAELLYNATDGQFLVEHLAVYDNRRRWDDADIRIYANLNQHSVADVAGLFTSTGHIYLNPNDAHEPSVTLHELGHYAFGVYDEYKAGPDWEPSDGPHVCTLASLEDGSDFSEGGSKDSCLMRGARNAEVKKICSTHPANPHATTTAQGLRDCWSDILSRYGDARWRLLSPVSVGRGAIVDALPDSGVPQSTSTAPPPGVGTVASYIPVEGWKPQRRRSTITRPGECPNRLVRAVLDGSPLDDVKVWLVSGSSKTYQGVTNPYTQAYGETNGHGEIRLRGAHVGDRVDAQFWRFPSVAYGAAEIPDCGPEALVITLRRLSFPRSPRVEPAEPGELRVVVEAEGRAATADVRLLVDGVARPMSFALPEASDPPDASLRGRLIGLPATGRVDVEVAALDPEGKEIAVRTSASFVSTHDEEALSLKSADGGLELIVPPGALPLPVELVVQTVAAPPAPPDGYAPLGDAYAIASSQGDRLAVSGLLAVGFDFDPNGVPRTGRALHQPEIVRLTDDGERWEPIERQERAERYVGARIDRLGTFAVVDWVQAGASPSTMASKHHGHVDRNM